MSDLWERTGGFNRAERLSVTLMRDHVLGGHEGKYEAYCYRCQFFQERQERAQWELAAIERPRWWISDWPHWKQFVSLGGDEFFRRTLCIGPLVIALWRFPMDLDTAEYMAGLRKWAEGDEGQSDRDKQPKRRSMDTDATSATADENWCICGHLAEHHDEGDGCQRGDPGAGWACGCDKFVQVSS